MDGVAIVAALCSHGRAARQIPPVARVDRDSDGLPALSCRLTLASMNATDRAILEEVAARIRDIEPRARIWAFGSRARGDAERYSDFDVCVVLPTLDSKIREAIGRIGWEVGLEHDVLVQDVLLSEDDFEHGPMSASPLVRTIRREGLAA